MLSDLGSLADESPRMVPLVDGAEEWAERLLAGALDPHEAIALLPDRERVRLLSTFEELFPYELAEARGSCDEQAVESAILIGAIVAALDDSDESELCGGTLDAIEGDVEFDDRPVEALAFALDGCRLWDDTDGGLADRELEAIPEWLDEESADRRFREILADVVSRRAGEWHAERLARMVHEVRTQLPVDGYPRASALLTGGCARFDADPQLAKAIAVDLLIDVLPLSPPVFDEDLVERWAA